jgi:hypothetical protein
MPRGYEIARSGYSTLEGWRKLQDILSKALRRYSLSRRRKHHSASASPMNSSGDE